MFDFVRGISVDKNKGFAISPIGVRDEASIRELLERIATTANRIANSRYCCKLRNRADCPERCLTWLRRNIRSNLQV